MALWAGVVVAVELIVAHPVAMETCSPVAYVRIRELFIVLGYCEIGGVRRAWVIRDVDIGGKRGAFCPLGRIGGHQSGKQQSPDSVECQLQGEHSGGGHHFVGEGQKECVFPGGEGRGQRGK